MTHPPGETDDASLAPRVVEPAARAWLLRSREWILVALLPLVFFWGYGVQRFYLLSGADPFIYLGYSVSLADLINRFGYPYYAVRFGLIVPSNVASELFGVVDGYFVVRWVVSVVAAGTVFQFLRQRYRWETGAVAAGMLLLNPIYVRAIMTMYSTTIVVPFVCGAAALLLMTGSRRVVIGSRAFAGALLGLSVNANSFALLPIAAMLLVWLVARARVGRRQAMLELGFVAVFAVAITAAGMLIYWIRFGNADIIRPSIDAARSLSNGGHFPGTEVNLRWLNFRPETWLPLVASVLLLFALRIAGRPARWFELAAAFMPLAMWAFYGFHEFVLGGYMLETYYYSSYMLGPSVVAIVMGVALLIERWSRGPRWLYVVAMITILAGPPAWTHIAPHLSVYTMNGVVPIVIVIAALIWSATRWSWVAAAAVACITCVPLVLSIGSPRDVPLSSGQPFRQDAAYYQVFNHYDDGNLDLYAMAADLASAVPRAKVDPGSVVFWYEPDDYVAGLSQWTYLGPYSTLHTQSSPPLPALDDAELNSLTNRTPRYLVLLSGYDDTRLGIAEVAIEAIGLQPLSIERGRFSRGPYVLYASIIEFTPSICDTSEQGRPVKWYELPACQTS